MFLVTYISKNNKHLDKKSYLFKPNVMIMVGGISMQAGKKIRDKILMTIIILIASNVSRIRENR